MYVKDSVVVILKAAEDGYSASYYIFNRSPPPAPRLQDLLDSVVEEQQARDFEGVPIPGETTGGVRERQDRISADKASLIAEFTALVNTKFDI